MGKSLINPPQLHGLSKTKIIWFGTGIGVLLLSFILYGIFAEDEKTKNTINSDMVTNDKYNPADSSKAINQILQQVDNKLKRNVSNTITSVLPITSQSRLIKSVEQESIVPPIITNNNDGVQVQKQSLQAKQRFEQKQVDNQYSSLSAKTLMFSHIPTKVNTSAPNISTNYESKQLSIVDNTDNNLSGQIEMSQSPYELKAGSVIPATMINGINSDLPGSIIAQVRANIYNSTTRQYLLIPQGAKLVGSYDSHIIYGQERLIVAWQRLIYPDGSSINLHALPGSDLEGYSGFYDQVDNKYWKIFGTSFIMGVITAGMQYSQNNTNANVQSGGFGVSTSSNPTMGQTLSGSLGQQLGQTGLAITQKNLNVQPTLIIRPNYPFNIMLTADLALKPWPKPKIN